MRTCAVEGCGKKWKSRGRCAAHEWRMRKYGTIELPPKPTLEERFWARVEKTDTCWNWMGGTINGGYGAFDRFDTGTQTVAHRFSFELANGPIPEGMLVDHLCFNRACCNPAHLRLATPKQNQENRSGAQITNRSGIRGVTKPNGRPGWQAAVYSDYKCVYQRMFPTKEEAEAAVIAKRLEIFTHSDMDKRTA